MNNTKYIDPSILSVLNDDTIRERYFPTNTNITNATNATIRSVILFLPTHNIQQYAAMPIQIHCILLLLLNMSFYHSPVSIARPIV